MKPFQKIVRTAVLALAILAFSAGQALAVVAAKTLTVGAGSGTAGQTAEVLIPITINDPSGVGGIAFTIAYDQAALTFLGLSSVATTGWPIQDPEAFKVPTPDVLEGVAYYNPYTKEAPYAASTYTTVAASNLFYQFNPLTDGSGNPIGRVMVSGASADPLTGTTLFAARFQIKAAAVGGTVYPVRLFRSIIGPDPVKYPNSGDDPAVQAGYTTSTFLPVLVGTGDKVGGVYTTLDFPVIPATLVDGKITVTATAYSIGGKVTYGSATGTAAAGCTVILYKETAPGSGSYVFRERTTVGATGAYNFANRYPGNFKIGVESLDPGFNNYESASPIELTNGNIGSPEGDAILLAKPRPDYVVGNVTEKNGLTLPTGLLVKVVDPTENVMGIYGVGADGNWKSGLLPPLGEGLTYHWYLVYGSLTSAKDATTFDVSVLKTISGTISGLPGTGGAVTAISVAGKIQKTIQQGADGSYTISNLVAANDYIVSAVGTGLPLTYYNGKADVNEATPVDISTNSATGIDFNFVTPVSHITGAITESGQGVAVGTTVYGFEVNTFSLISTATGTGGAYDLTVPKGTYEVFVIKNNGKIFYFYNEDGTPTQNEGNALLRTVATDGQTVTNTNIDITECDKTLTGNVSKENGDLVANVLISVSNATKSALGLTGQDGNYSVGGLCDGDAYTVEMKPLVGNFAVQTASIVAGTDTVKNFVIDTGAVLSGTVTDQGAGTGVSGAMIYLKDYATGALVGGRIYFSAANGTYGIRDIKSGEYTLEVTHPDYNGYTVNLVIGADDLTQNVALNKGAFFKGAVTDSVTAKALAGATVIVTRTGATPVYTVTNPAGNYSVYGLDATKSDYIIIAQRRGYERQAQTLKTPATSGTTVDFALTPPTVYYTVSGKVKTDATTGADIEGAIVLVSSTSKNFFATTTTATDGTYSVGNLIAANDYKITVIPPGLPTQESTFAVGPNATKDFTISLGKDIGGAITGSVAIPSTTKIYVVLYKGTAYQGFLVAGAADGKYLFKGLVDGNDYKIAASASGYAPQWYNGKVTPGTADPIDITGGNQTAVNITLIKQ